MSQASLPAATASDSLRKVMPALLSESMKFRIGSGVGGSGGIGRIRQRGHGQTDHGGDGGKCK